jgi:KaiC/GvpD/RAD55 family RecA-like ATPase
MVTGWLRQEGVVLYHDYTRPTEAVRTKLKRIGLDVQGAEKNGKLQIWDWYTCQLGQKSTERKAVDSLKVPDLSIRVSREFSHMPESEFLNISDNTSAVARFNDERAWVEYVITRIVPMHSSLKAVGLRGLMKGIHSDWACRQLEGAHHGIIDFKLEEEGKTTRDLIRVRSMQDVAFDREWHQLKINENFEVTLE